MLTPWKESMTNLGSIFKSRDITLPTKVRLVKAMVFPVVLYWCESWTVKKAECWRIDAFELWCWRRLLRVPWTARRSNQSILKEINPGISLERMMLKLKLQYFGHLMQRVDSGKDPDAGRDWGQEKGTTEDEMAGWMWVWVNSGRWWWTGRPGVLWFMGSQRVGHDWATELSWTEKLALSGSSCYTHHYLYLEGIAHLGHITFTSKAKSVLKLWQTNRTISPTSKLRYFHSIISPVLLIKSKTWEKKKSRFLKF